MAEIRPIISTVGTPNASLVESNSSVIGRTGAEMMREGTAQIKEGLDFIQAERERAERARIMAEQASAQAEFTMREQHLARTADPNEYADQAEKLLLDYDQRLTDIGGNIKTRVNADAWTAESAKARGAFSVQVMAEMTEKFGQAQAQNYLTASNQYSSTIRTNPAMWEAVNEQTMALETMMPDVPYDQRQQLLNASLKVNAQAYVEGTSANGNFDKARELLDSGELDEYLDGSDKDTLYRRIDQDEDAARIDAANALDLQMKQRELEFDTAMGEIYGGIFYDNNSVPHIPDNTMQRFNQLAREYPELSDKIEGARGFLKTQYEDRAAGIPSYDNFETISEFEPRLFMDLTEEEVYTARNNHLLANETANRYLAAIRSRDSGEGTESQKHQRFMRLAEGFQKYIEDTSWTANDAPGRAKYGEYLIQSKEWFNDNENLTDQQLYDKFREIAQTYIDPGIEDFERDIDETIARGLGPEAITIVPSRRSGGEAAPDAPVPMSPTVPPVPPDASIGTFMQNRIRQLQGQ